MANKYMKKCSILLATKGMQIKMTVRFLFVTVRIAIIKKKTTNDGENVGKK
jgi:hypothetical protein